METLKTNYNTISQIYYYFKSLENISDLTFSQKRRLIRLNEELEKEFSFFTNEIQSIANKYCEKDENGNFIQAENGGQKIKEDCIDIVNANLNSLYNTEVELHFQPFKLPEQYFEKLKCDSATIILIEENFLEE